MLVVGKEKAGEVGRLEGVFGGKEGGRAGE